MSRSSLPSQSMSAALGMFWRSEKMGSPVDVAQGVGGEDVLGGTRAAVVAVVADVAVGRFRQQVEVAVQVHVGEPVPVPHREVGEGVGLPAVLAGARADVAEEHDPVGVFLEEEIQIAVAVRVGQLGARQVEAAQQGVVDEHAGLVAELDVVDDALPPGVRRGRLAGRADDGKGEEAGEHPDGRGRDGPPPGARPGSARHRTPPGRHATPPGRSRCRPDRRPPRSSARPRRCGCRSSPRCPRRRCSRLRGSGCTCPSGCGSTRTGSCRPR